MGSRGELLGQDSRLPTRESICNFSRKESKWKDNCELAEVIEIQEKQPTGRTR